jgi:hypothetical protein
MIARRGIVRRTLLPAVLLTSSLLAGCQTAAEQEAELERSQRGGGRAGRGGGKTALADEVARLRAENEKLRVISAEKDTLLFAVRETQAFIDEVDRALGRLPGVDTTAQLVVELGGAEMNGEADVRAAVLDKLRQAGEHIARTEALARERAERVRALTGETRQLRKEIAAFEETVQSLRAIIAGQQSQIDELTTRLAELEEENRVLAERNGVLEDTVRALTQRENEVYVVAGTERELLEAGIVTREGGAKIVILGTVGQLLIPARRMPVERFGRIDRLRDTELRLPNPYAQYRIVSRHDPAYLEEGAGRDGFIQGVIRIEDPERFWAASRYLILVQVR